MRTVDPTTLIDEVTVLEPGRAYLFTALGHYRSTDVLRKVIPPTVVENDSLQIAHCSEGLLSQVDLSLALLASEISQFSWDDIESFLQGHPDKSVVIVTQLNQIAPDWESLEDRIYKLRVRCKQLGKSLVAYVPLGRDATMLATAAPESWHQDVLRGGYYKWSRKLDTEFDSVYLVDPTQPVVTLYRGKHRDTFN